MSSILHSGPTVADNAALAWRKSLMQACARADDADFENALAAMNISPQARDVRAPQTGLIMLRGRTGATGNAFNAGEATMTRAVVQLECGHVGYGFLLGRSHKRARLAAVFDALGQDEARRDALTSSFVQPVTARWQAERRISLEQTAATKVDFFTLVRGED